MTALAERTVQLVDRAFDAWAQDVSERVASNASVDVSSALLPAACVWLQVMQQQSLDRTRPKEFTTDLLRHDLAAAALSSCHGLYMSWRLDPSIQTPVHKAAAGFVARPERFTKAVIEAGRSVDDTVNGREVAVAAALGSLSYNSSSAGPMGFFHVVPIIKFSEGHEDDWKMLGFSHTMAFADILALPTQGVDTIST